jgi:hypothetical protein
LFPGPSGPAKRPLARSWIPSFGAEVTPRWSVSITQESASAYGDHDGSQTNYLDVGRFVDSRTVGTLGDPELSRLVQVFAGLSVCSLRSVLRHIEASTTPRASWERESLLIDRATLRNGLPPGNSDLIIATAQLAYPTCPVWPGTLKFIERCL